MILYQWPARKVRTVIRCLSRRSLSDENILSCPQAWLSLPGAFSHPERFEQMRKKSDDCNREKKVGLLPSLKEAWLTSRTGRGEILARDDWKRTPEQRRVCKALEKVATEVGASNIAVGELLAKGVESRAF